MPFSVPNPPSGQSFMAAWCRKLAAAVQANRLLSGRGYRIKSTPRGTILEIQAGGGGGAAGGLVMGEITTLFANDGTHHDYIGVTRRTATGTVGDEILVAKSLASRMAASYGQGGETYLYTYIDDNNRVSTRESDSATENQQLCPIFTVGQLIAIMPINLSFVVPAGGSDLQWIEVSTEREWTAPPIP